MRRLGTIRKAAALKRVSKGLDESVRLLIACEGSKTEPNYFRELCRLFRIRTATVVVAGEECGSAPLSVFQYAAKRLTEDKSFDEVYCVFDRDRHETFDDAVRGAQSHQSGKFSVIASFPCFEYWVLLHFRFTRAPFVASCNLSPGDATLRALRSEWTTYKKGDVGTAEFLCSDGRLEAAVERASRARADALATGEPNPSTDVDLLVTRLKRLGESQVG